MKHLKLFENYFNKDDNFDFHQKIKELRDDYMKDGRTPIDINSGDCHFFAEDLEYLYGKYGVKKLHGYDFYELFRDTDLSDLKKVYGSSNLIINDSGAWIKKNLEKYGYPPTDLNTFNKDMNHAWVVFKGRYYDAENPNGVDNWYELDAMKRFGYFEKHT